jgi:hypothetical protein
MRGEQGEGRGPKDGDAKAKAKTKSGDAAAVKSKDKAVENNSSIDAAKEREAIASQTPNEQTRIEDLEHLKNLEQVEYLIFQSTQGVHFMFDNSDIAKVLSQPTESKNFFTETNMKKVQGLLTKFLDCSSIQAKRSYLDHLPKEDFELLVRAYFQLVDNTILAHSTIRH